MLLAVERRGHPATAAFSADDSDHGHAPAHRAARAQHAAAPEPRAARGHLQHPQGRARRRPAQAAGDPQPRARHRGARHRSRLPAGGALAEPRRGEEVSRHAPGLAAHAAGRLPRARGLRGRLPHQRDDHPRRARQRAALALAARRHRPPRCVGSPLRAARPAARAGALERRAGARDRRALRADPLEPGAAGRAAREVHRGRRCRRASC